jgi:hypothetical protein
MAFIVCPIIVGVLVIGGALLGSSLAGFLGFSKTDLEVAAATLGLVVSLPIVVAIVTWVVKQEPRETKRATSAERPPSP